uniref:Putative ovule protein n=1 Tax=Solanum chacoense TaxID=4108 RepID=A0A0V0H8F7_SOLCH
MYMRLLLIYQDSEVFVQLMLLLVQTPLPGGSHTILLLYSTKRIKKCKQQFCTDLKLTGRNMGD